ncbi:MAPEG family protein [Aquabacter sp. CN5-332]|uniref:MAPEG family protein n=1 Tax=Aquabacter sp. CN5-332 TaxID=3156608 RepID=UPI0032B4DC05
MTVAMILLPLFVQVALTFALLFILGPLRARAVATGEAGPDVALDREAYPPPCRKVANAFHNQFELPVLFYVLTALALFTRKADLIFVILAWVFVLSRIIHAVIHATSNDMRLRFPAYALGAIILALMWVLFALAILLNI